MPRPPDGITAKDQSRTALFAYIAARLHGRQAKADEDRFFREHKLNVSSAAAQKAARRSRDQHGASLMTKWLLIDEPRLDLDVALLRFAGDGRRQSGLVETLASLAGLRQVIEIAGTFDVLAIAVFDGRIERRHLQARVQEITGLDPAWFDVERETWAPSRATWSGLAVRAAEQDQLRLP